MGVVYEYFTFDGTSSRDYEVWISGNGTFDAPERDVENIPVPGRNGDLHIDNERFMNMSITYPAFITKDFKQNFDAFKAFLLSKRGYKRLEDSYNPECYRLATYRKSISPEMAPLNRAGSFEIIFDCDPRRFLKSGDRPVEFTADGPLRNPTLFDAKPLIRAYGTGYFIISGIRVNITLANAYTDIDCELQEAYKGSTNCNGNITLVNGEFPVLKSGSNAITLSGLSRIEITPRWWTI